MTFTHHDIQDRLIGYLYGELGADDRAAFEGHLASCAACGAEVSALRATRSASRQAVRASLDEAVPAGVHGRVMEAAMRAARSRVATAEVLEAPAKQHRFAWLRARWALPLFATVAAMGALLLTRETIFREARHPLGESPAPAPPVPHPSPPPENAPETPTVSQPTDDRSAAVVAPSAPLGAADQQQERSRSQGGEGKAASRPKAGARVAASARKAETATEKKAVPMRDQLRSVTESARPQVRAPAPRTAEVDQARAEQRKRGDISDNLRDSSDVPAPSAAVAPTAAAGAPPAEGAAAPTPVHARAAAQPPQLAKEFSAGAESDPTMVLAGRADDAMRSGNWPEAISVYGDLLRRFPRHPSAALWRRQLATAQAAVSRPAGTRFTVPPPAR
ncbi:MAG: zf-HC2 domain-containing protein [Myxococcales bacterium]